MKNYKGLISYAHNDNDNEGVKIADIFIKKFKTYAQNNNISTWYDRDIVIGNDWFEEIKEAIKRCK